ncbi:MAG TPA: class I SAM-dependent methyltransferase [Bacteroidia bacterium]|jgi:2-polyprenyl-3-methyl-5-hydroxy-6-metoxy-1,4-benzoquinol methylase|nr:class I SAM-dependent methyltransferase [Bacteroidia bacterium]
MISNKELIKFLEKTSINSGFVDKLKIKYRPVICPFDDLLKYTHNKKKLFDIGCGSGQFSLVAANFTGVEKIMGIEISEVLINNANALAAKYGAGKEFIFKTFDGAHFPDEMSDYEVIFLIDVLHHVPKDKQHSFLESIFKKMAPGAQLILKDINGASPFVLCNKMHDIVFAGEIGNEISVAKAKKWLEGTGFKIKEEYTKQVFVYPHYFLIAEKPLLNRA